MDLAVILYRSKIKFPFSISSWDKFLIRQVLLSFSKKESLMEINSFQQRLTFTHSLPTKIKEYSIKSFWHEASEGSLSLVTFCSLTPFHDESVQVKLFPPCWPHLALAIIIISIKARELGQDCSSCWDLDCCPVVYWFCLTVGSKIRNISTDNYVSQSTGSGSRWTGWKFNPNNEVRNCEFPFKNSFYNHLPSHFRISCKL